MKTRLITTLAIISIAIQKSIQQIGAFWNTPKLLQTKTLFQLDSLRLDLTDLFTGNTVTNFNYTLPATVGKITYYAPTIVTVWNPVSLRPQRYLGNTSSCSMLTWQPSLVDESYYIICQKVRLLKIKLISVISPEDNELKTEYLIEKEVHLGQTGSMLQQGGAFNFDCGSIALSGTLQDLFLACRGLDGAGNEWFQVLQLHPVLLAIKDRVVFQGNSNTVLGPKYKLLVLGDDNDYQVGYCLMIIQNNFNQSSLTSTDLIGYRLNSRILMDRTAVAFGNTTIVNYPTPDRGQIVGVVADTQSFYFVLRTKSSDITSATYNYTMLPCLVKGPVSQFKCNRIPTVLIFQTTSSSDDTTDIPLVTFSVKKSTRVAGCGDVVFASTTNSITGTLSPSGGFNTNNGIHNFLYPLFNHTKVKPMAAFWVRNKTIIWFQDYQGDYLKIINVVTGTSLDVDLRLPFQARNLLLRTAVINSDNDVLIAFGDEQLVANLLKRPDIIFSLDSKTPVTNTIRNQTYQLIANYYSNGTMVAKNSTNFTISYLTNFRAGLSFGNASQNSYGYTNSWVYIPTFDSTIKGNAPVFAAQTSSYELSSSPSNYREDYSTSRRMLSRSTTSMDIEDDYSIFTPEEKLLEQTPAKLPPVWIRYAGPETVSLGQNLQKVVSGAAGRIQGNPQELFWFVSEASIVFGSCQTNATNPTLSCSVLFTVPVLVNNQTAVIQRIIDVTYFRGQVIVMMVAQPIATEAGFTSLINIYSIGTGTGALIQSWSSPDLVMTSGTIFEQNSIVKIYMTVSNKFTGRLGVGDALYFAAYSAEYPTNRISPIPVALPNFNKICAQQMKSYPTSIRGKYTFAISSRCPDSKSNETSIYQFSFNWKNALALSQTHRQSLQRFLNPKFCMTANFIHLADINANNSVVKIVSLDANENKGSMYQVPTTIYNVINISQIICNPNRGLVHYIANVKPQGTTKQIVITLNGNKVQSPFSRVHSIVPISNTVISAAVVSKPGIDESVILGLYKNAQGKGAIQGVYVDATGPHIRINATGVGTAGVKSYKVQMSSYGSTNTPNATKTYNLNLTTLTRAGSLKLSGSKASISSYNGKKIVLNQVVQFIGPVCALQYQPVANPTGNPNILNNRTDPLPVASNPWGALQAPLTGFASKGNFALVWNSTGASFYSSASGNLKMLGATVNGTVIGGEVLTYNKTMNYAFAVMYNDQGANFLAAWYINKQGAWVSNSSTEINNDVNYPNFLDLTIYGQKVFLMVSASNKGSYQLQYHRFYFRNGQFYAQQYPNLVTYFNSSIKNIKAINIQGRYVVTMVFADYSKGTWFEGVKFYSRAARFLRFGQGYYSVINDIVKSGQFGGHITDHYKAQFDCFLLPKDPTKVAWFINCVYATYGSYSYSTQIGLNLTYASYSQTSLVVANQSTWKNVYYNPPGYYPFAATRGQFFSGILFVREPQFASPTITKGPLTKKWIFVLYNDVFPSGASPDSQRQPYAYLTADMIGADPDFGFSNAYPKIQYIGSNTYTLIINNGGRTKTGKNIPTLNSYNLTKYQFNIKDATKVSASKDKLVISDWSEAGSNSVPLSNYFQ